MAGIRAIATTGELSTGTSAKTLLQLLAASNHRVLLHELMVTFKGTSSTASPILVELIRQTAAGTMSASTINKVDPGVDETLQTTATENASSEPSGTEVLNSWLVHPQGGATWQAQFGGAYVIPGGGRLGIRVTASADVNATVSATIEE